MLKPEFSKKPNTETSRSQKRCRVSVFRLVQQKLPDALHGQGGFSGWKHLEHMPHVVPNLQLAMHVIRQHPLAQTNTIRV